MIEPTREMVHEIYSRINFVDHDDSGIYEGLVEVFKMLDCPEGFQCSLQLVAERD